MMGLITLGSALLLQTSSPSTAALSLTENDIQLALSQHHDQLSSSGSTLAMYAVRNLRCAQAELDAKFEPSKENPLHFMSERGIHQVSCSYDYIEEISVHNVSRHKRVNPKPKQFTARKIKRFAENQWRNQTQEFVYMQNMQCLRMGIARTPKSGECSSRWALVF
jgi:hypothetical protein